MCRDVRVVDLVAGSSRGREASRQVGFGSGAWVVRRCCAPHISCWRGEKHFHHSKSNSTNPSVTMLSTLPNHSR